MESAHSPAVPAGIPDFGLSRSHVAACARSGAVASGRPATRANDRHADGMLCTFCFLRLLVVISERFMFGEY